MLDMSMVRKIMRESEQYKKFIEEVEEEITKAAKNGKGRCKMFSKNADIIYLLVKDLKVMSLRGEYIYDKEDVNKIIGIEIRWV